MIQLAVGHHVEGDLVHFSVRSDAPLAKLMVAFCRRMGLQLSQVCFFTCDHEVMPDDTAVSLGLLDGDVILFDMASDCSADEQD